MHDIIQLLPQVLRIFVYRKKLRKLN